MTTTAPVTDPELETRCLSFTLDDSREQTGRIFGIVADLEEGDAALVDYEPWHELQQLARRPRREPRRHPVRARSRRAHAEPWRRGSVATSSPCSASCARARCFTNAPARGTSKGASSRRRRLAAVHGLLDDLVAEGVDASVSPATRDTVETCARCSSTPSTPPSSESRTGSRSVARRRTTACAARSPPGSWSTSRRSTSVA